MRTIAHISDLHFGRLDPPVAEGLVADLNANPPTLLVASGDFTQRARTGQFRLAMAYMKRLPRPQLVIPGNHDVPLWDLLWMRRLFSPLGKYRKLVSQDLRPVYRDDEMLVIGVNTARRIAMPIWGFWKNGSISAEQLLDVKLTAADAPAGAMKIVVTHHPFIPPPTDLRKGIIHNHAAALRQMEESGVDVLLAGHLHKSYSEDVRGFHVEVKRSILSIQAGTASSDRRRNEPNAYNWLTIDHNSLTVEVRAWNGKGFGTQTVKKFTKINDVWTIST